MIELTGNTLTIEQLVAIARSGAAVAPLGEAICSRMAASHRWVMDAIAQHGQVVYGVNTGFGSLATRQISAAEARQLSRNVVVLCAVGVGRPLAAEIVRAIMVIRANMLAKGHSGVRPSVAQTLIAMLNAGVTPVVPEKGSLGASGDLAPLAHIAVVLDARRRSSRWRLQRAGLVSRGAARRRGGDAPRRHRACGLGGERGAGAHQRD